MSLSTPGARPGRLYVLPCSPDSAETGPLGGMEHLARARLVVVSPGVPAEVSRHVPDDAPVIYLPSGLSGPVETALELARQMVVGGEMAVWLEPAGLSPRSGRDGSHESDDHVQRWLAERGIEVVAPVEKTPGPSLAGNWVLLARPRRQAIDSVGRLGRLGATVVSQPAIAIGRPADPGRLDAAIDRLESYDWIVFSSANGVRFFTERLWERSGDLRRLGGARLAAIGPGTADALAQYRLRADVVPDEHRAEALAESLAGRASGKRFLLVRASRGREILAEVLLAAGAQVEQVVAYDSTDVSPEPASLAPVEWLLDQDRIDWLVVSSSAIARSVDRLFGQRLEKTRLASISPITSDVLRQLGHEPAVEAKNYTFEGILQAMLGQ